MELVVRWARRGEGARLREIRLASLGADPAAFGSSVEREEGRPSSWWASRAELSEAGVEQRTFVAVDDADRWVGLALVRRDEERPGVAVINAMWVAPEGRGRGAGVALCDACVAWARSRGFALVELAVIADNAPALRAYRAAGFEVTGAEHTLDDGRRELTMTRRVAGPPPG